MLATARARRQTCRRHRRKPRHRRRHRRGVGRRGCARVASRTRCGQSRACFRAIWAARTGRFPIVADVTDPPSVQSAFAAARGRFGPVHIADQQRRTGRERQIHRYRRGAVGPAVRGQSHRHLPLHPPGGAGHVGRRVRPNRQYREHRRPARRRLHFRVCELEACGHRPDPLAGSRVREPEHHGERGVPGLSSIPTS